MGEQLDLFSAGAQAVISVAGDEARRRKGPREFKISTPEETAALVARAIAEGRHSTQWQTVCFRCKEWVAAIFHINPQNSRERYCRKCAATFGIEGAAERVAVEDSADLLPALPFDPGDGTARAEDYGLPPF